MKKQQTPMPKFKTAKEEAEYWEGRTQGPPSPSARFSPAKPGRKIDSQILPLTFQEIDELGRIATEQGISIDTLVQKALREAIQHHSSSTEKSNKLPAKRALARNITRSAKPKTPAAA